MLRSGGQRRGQFNQAISQLYHAFIRRREAYIFPAQGVGVGSDGPGGVGSEPAIPAHAGGMESWLET